MTLYESMLAAYSRDGGTTATPNAEQEVCQKITLPDLFAGKMHALVYRAWQRRVKGRDWFDFEWYVRQGVPLDFKHLQARIKEFNGEEVSRETFFAMLRKKLSTTDIDLVKQDVLPYIDSARQEDLAIWSHAYFLQLVDMMKIQG